MGTVECVKQQHHHQVQQHKYHQMNSSSFKIPLWLCMRPSITQEDYDNQDHLSKWGDNQNSSNQQDNNNKKKNKSKKNHNTSSSSSCSIDKEDQPGSPKVGCMGQVKHNHQQLTFLSTNNHHQQQHTRNNKKYFKLNKMFSSNSFNYTRTTSRTNHMITTTTTTTTGPNNSKLIFHHHNTKDQQEQHAPSSSDSSSSSSSELSSTTTTSSFSLASVGDLDPPLPVIKRSLTTNNVCSSDVSSIWKRRCGGEAALKGLQLSSTIKRVPINSIVMVPQPLAYL